MAVIETKQLISVDVGENKNRWWKGELYDNGDVVTSWGRVGSHSEKTFPGAGKHFLDKKFREKLRKGYTETKTVASNGSSNVTSLGNTELHSIAKSQLIKSSNPILDNLINRFIKANVHKITENTTLKYNADTGLFSTPLGILTMDAIGEGRDTLAKIAGFVRKHKYGSDLSNLVGLYLRIVPQKVGRKLIVEDLFPDDNAIQKQNDLLDSLESSYKSLQTAKPIVTDSGKVVKSVFKVDLDVLSDAKERQRLIDYYEKSKKAMHHYDRIKVREIFQVRIHEMHDNFNSGLRPIKEVFHGTSQANCLSILKSGLKVSPPSTAAIAGKAFGNGLYGAINSTKSLGYAFNRWGQGGVGDAGWLFICDFAMGKIQDPGKTSNRLQSGYDSLWARAGDRFYNDELIVYKNNQVNIKYLLECK
jgi:poly [ADP-ribose] polymerase 2/3/4